MKKILFGTAFSALAAICVLSCASNKVSSDSYGDDDPAEMTKISAPARNTGGASSDGGDPYSKEKIRGNRTFAERMFNLNKYEKVDTMTCSLRPTVGSLFSRKGSLIYKDGTDLAGFLMLYDTSTYALFLARNEREALVKAVARYMEDFENKKLSAKTKKSERVYGFVTGYEEFGIVAAMMTNYSKPKVYFGYKFINNSPYFCIYAVRAENLGVNTTQEGAVKQSVDQKYYFTKAQAQALADFVSEENIAQYYRAEEEFSPEPQADEY